MCLNSGKCISVVKQINYFYNGQILSRKSSLSSKSTPQSQLGPLLDRSISWCQNRMRCGQINQIEIICYDFISSKENCLIRSVSLLSLRSPAYTDFCQMRRILIWQKLRTERMTIGYASPPPPTIENPTLLHSMFPI